MGVARALWWRWLSFGWIGRLASIAIGLYAFGWLLGNLGMNAAARQLAAWAILVFGVLVTWLIIRLSWRDATARHQWPR